MNRPPALRPSLGANSKNSFRERLGAYLLGTAIGCVLLGLFWLGKQRALQQEHEQQSQQAAPAQTPPPGSGGPP